MYMLVEHCEVMHNVICYFVGGCDYDYECEDWLTLLNFANASFNVFKCQQVH